MLFLNLQDPEQLQLSLLVLASIREYTPLNDEQTPKFKEWIDYVYRTWFRTESPHFVGRLSNFYEDILQNKTPQLTNNVSESLNAVIKKAYKVGFISKATMVTNLRTFYLKQWEKYQVFINGEKQRNRSKKDLEKYRRMKIIVETIQSVFPTLSWEDKSKFHCEAVFKLSKVEFNNLHRLFLRSHPMGNYVQRINL